MKGKNKMNTIAAIENRIALLQSRPNNNAPIIAKLTRKLRKLKATNA